MNILQHIKAGHYPKDTLGRALVPVNGKWTATIAAIDGPREEEIAGFGPCSWVVWNEDGKPVRIGNPEFDTLLPPPPRKRIVKGWAILGSGGNILEIRKVEPDRLAVSPRNVIELTGEHEENW